MSLRFWGLAGAAAALALLGGCGGEPATEASAGGEITEAKLKAAADEADKVPASGEAPSGY